MKQKKAPPSKNATKRDLELLERTLRSELLKLDVKVERRFESVEERIEESDENAIKYKDEILTKLDGVMGELQTMREENTVGTYQISEVKEQVDNHEKRIQHLEKPQQIT